MVIYCHFNIPTEGPFRCADTHIVLHGLIFVPKQEISIFTIFYIVFLSNDPIFDKVPVSLQIFEHNFLTTYPSNIWFAPWFSVQFALQNEI